MKQKFFFILLILCSSISFAQNNDFNNGGGDQLWSNTANWTLGVVPNTTNTGQVRLILNSESQVNTPITIKKIQNTFGTSVNTSVGGTSILTIDPGANAVVGITNVSSSNVNMIFNGNLTINNTVGVSISNTLAQNANGSGNGIQFSSSSTLTLTTPLELRQSAGGDNFSFDGDLVGSSTLRINTGATATFGSTADNSGFSGDIVYVGSGSVVVNNSDNNIFLPNGRKLQINANNGSVEVNGANVFDGNITVGGTNTFTADFNKNQDNIGSIILSASGTLNLIVDSAVSNLTFADNSANAWNTGTLNITGFRPGIIRFGSSSSGLTSGQLSQIIADGDGSGKTLALDEKGYLVIAPDKTWNGSVSTDWTNASNWTGGVPGASDKVLIPSGLTNYPAIATAVTVSSVDVEAGAVLVTKDATSFTGTVTYKRYLGTTNWYLTSSPVSGEIMTDMRLSNVFADGSAGSRIGFAGYDDSNAANAKWEYFTSSATDALTNGKGYSAKLAATGNLSFTGTINTADVTPTVASAGNGFNLVGNPYTAHMNSKIFLDANTNLDQTQLWVWNQASGMYEVKTNGSATILAPTQGFFVKVNSGTQVSFAESNQLGTGGTFQRSSLTELKLIMTDGQSSRFTKLHYSDQATRGFDSGWEGEVFGGIPNSLEVFTHLLEDNKGKKYQIQSLANSDVSYSIIPIGVIAEAGKELTFSLEAANFPTDVNVYIEDRIKNTFNEVSGGNKFTVTLDEKLNDVGRFYMHTTSKALNTKDIDVTSSISIFKTNTNSLKIVGLSTEQSTLKLFNILGKQVLQTSFTANGTKEISLPNLAKGVYIVQLETITGSVNKKIILE